MIQNVHLGRWQGYDTKALLSSFGENRVFHYIFVAINQIMKQSTTVLSFFSIPR